METLERVLGRVVEEGRVALQQGGKGVGKGVEWRRRKGEGKRKGKGKGKGRALGLDAARFNRMGYGTEVVEVVENGGETETEDEGEAENGQNGQNEAEAEVEEEEVVRRGGLGGWLFGRR